jgi:hypothetical protein
MAFCWKIFFCMRVEQEDGVDYEVIRLSAVEI